MKHLFFKTTVFVVLFFIARPIFGAVIINEIMYDLETGSDGGREWTEIFNNGDASVDLTGWKFFENNTNHGLTVTQGNIVLSANGYAVIADDPSKFLIDNPGFSGTIFDSAFSLSNDGEELTIKDNNLSIIDETNYNSTQGANGNGRSLQKDGSIWKTGTPTPGTLNSFSAPPEEPASGSSSTGGSQDQTIPSASSINEKPVANAGDNIIGFVNQEVKFDGSKSSDPDTIDLHYEWNMGNGKLIEEPSPSYIYAFPGTYLVTLTVFDGKNYASDTITVKVEQAQITINEFLANPSDSDETSEWIEIYNDSNFITDISGWQLDDSASSSKAFTFPENTLIAPKSYLVFSRPITKVTLNNDIDSVKLLMPGGILFQEINYEKPPQGKSSARTEEGFVWSDPSPGMINIITASPEPVEGDATYQNIVAPQTTKNSTKMYSINLTENEIEGGYLARPNEIGAAINSTNSSGKQNSTNSDDPASSAGELASIKQGSQNPINLVFIIIAIVFGMGFLGLILVKFRKRGLPT